MIDYKSEAADIATVYADGSSVAACERAILNLCRRVDEEATERAAGLADAMAIGETTITGRQKAINIAADDVVAHWRSIAAGTPPFGLRVSGG